MRYLFGGTGGSLIVCGLLLLGLLSMSLTPPLMRQGTSRTKLERRLYTTNMSTQIGLAGVHQLLIPRVVHQTYKTRRVTRKQEQLLHSWRVRNPLWTFRFYDDAACIAFVAEEFPQWLGAYNALPLAVERADFFRYMVVLRHGGVYADFDTECGLPLDDFIQPDDSFLAGWEDEHATAHAAIDSKFARQRQIQQWLFAATPGHPVLKVLCELIAAMAFDPIEDVRTDALFRSGPAPFTDIVLRHALQNPLSLRPNPHRMRILPRVALGGLPSGFHGVSTWNEPHRLAVHWSLGSWKSVDYNNKRAFTELDRRRAMLLLRPPSKADLGLKLYPVSSLTQPPFTLMTHLIGQGDLQGGIDVAAEVTSWGMPLAPGGFLLQQAPVEVFLDAWLANECAGKVLLDVGAGLGFYSLAAAARGLSAQAFELAPRSVASLQASIDYNGFNSQIALRQTALGQVGGEFCLERVGVNSSLNAIRGYGKASFHSLSKMCSKTAFRRTEQSMELSNLDVGAVRVSASGWEAWVLEGLQSVLQRSAVHVILLEVYPRLLLESGYSGRASVMLHRAQEWGFTNAKHMGHVCMGMKAAAQWTSAPLTSLAALFSRHMHARLIEKTLADPGLVWCQYRARKFQAKLYKLPDGVPELFLLTRSPGRPDS